jgi:hypothetical protein
MKACSRNPPIPVTKETGIIRSGNISKTGVLQVAIPSYYKYILRILTI